MWHSYIHALAVITTAVTTVIVTTSATTTTRKTALDRGRTDHISLTHDLNLQSPASNGHNLPTSKRSRSMVSWFQGQSGNKWKDGRTDRRMDGGKCITCHANVVGNTTTTTVRVVLLRPLTTEFPPTMRWLATTEPPSPPRWFTISSMVFGALLTEYCLSLIHI